MSEPAQLDRAPLSHGFAKAIGYTPHVEKRPVTVAVDDAAIRSQAPGFDGQERVFMLVPGKAGQPWEKFDLKYLRTDNGKDIYTTEMSAMNPRGNWECDGRPVDMTEIKRLGVAFGLETNVGTLWLQSPGDNTWPKDH